MAKLIEIDYEPGSFKSAPVSKLVTVDYEPEPYEGALPAPKKSVVLPSIKRTAGQFVESVGTTLEDITGENAVTRGLQDFGQGVVEANPSQINSVGDILENPWTTIKETVAEQVPQLGAAFTGARLGATAGGLVAGPPGAVVGGLIGGLAPIAIQEYGEIRGKQKETGEENIPLAIAGAGGATVLERFGLEKLATKAGAKGFGDVLDAIPDGTSRLAHAGKQGLKTALVEGPGTEIPQTAVERYAGGQEIGTQEAFDEYALAGVKGAIGGGAIGGGLGLVAPREQALPAETGGKVDGRTPSAAAPAPGADGEMDEVGIQDINPAAQRHMQDILQGGHR